MPKNSYPPKWGQKTLRELENITRFGYSMSDVFSDFVDLVLATLLSATDTLKYSDVLERYQEGRVANKYEERYRQITERYKENKNRAEGKRPADFFANAFGALVEETQTSLEDVLGDMYESQISHGEHGQFFSPPDIARMMVEVIGTKDGENVLEPACGSGRLLIASAKANPNRHFVGIDVSPVVARMCAVNMWLFNLSADIYQGNTLSMELSYVWKIRPGKWIWEAKIENGQEDGTIEAWLAEYRRNYPPLSEEERKARLEDYERHQKILNLIREMESYLVKFRAEDEETSREEESEPAQEITSVKEPHSEVQRQEPEEQPVAIQPAPASTEVARGVRRIDGYQPSDGDPLNVAYVFEREDLEDQIDAIASQNPHQRTTIGGFPALVTSANFAPMIEETIKNFLMTSETNAQEQPAPKDLPQNGKTLKRHSTKSAKRRAKKQQANGKQKPMQQLLFEDVGD